jgi:hypothetical protein
VDGSSTCRRLQFEVGRCLITSGLSQAPIGVARVVHCVFFLGEFTLKSSYLNTSFTFGRICLQFPSGMDSVQSHRSAQVTSRSEAFPGEEALTKLRQALDIEVRSTTKQLHFHCF